MTLSGIDNTGTLLTQLGGFTLRIDEFARYSARKRLFGMAKCGVRSRFEAFKFAGSFQIGLGTRSQPGLAMCMDSSEQQLPDGVSM